MGPRLCAARAARGRGENPRLIGMAPFSTEPTATMVRRFIGCIFCAPTVLCGHAHDSRYRCAASGSSPQAWLVGAKPRPPVFNWHDLPQGLGGKAVAPRIPPSPSPFSRPAALIVLALDY